MTYENESIEYKREYVDDICKEVIAFANTNGGKLLIGVDDSGNELDGNGCVIDEDLPF